MKHPFLFLLLSAFIGNAPLRADDSSLKGASKERIVQMGERDAEDTFRQFKASGFPQLSMDRYVGYAWARAVMRGLTENDDVRAYVEGYGVAMITLEK